MSDDGELAIVVIALVGNPFSPRYARARRRGAGGPLDFAAMNVAVYGPRGSAWSLRERRIDTADRSRDGIALGPSTMQWRGDALVIDIDERTTPFRSPLRGRVVVHPETLCSKSFALDARGIHRWSPVAPLAAVEVDLSSPGLRFRGHGYHDFNLGEEPLDAGFARWSWSRGRRGERAHIAYDVERADGTSRSIALRVVGAGALSEEVPVREVRLRRTIWGLDRNVRSASPSDTTLVRTLEDGPFYARSLVDTVVDGARTRVVHEVLDAERLRRRWVRFFTSFRMGRAP